MGYYICECNKEFTEPQKFNGHKGHCKIHLAAVGKLDTYADRQARASATGRNAYNQQRKDQKQRRLNIWVSEQHTCEKCGKIMIKKFGTGRFCSRACANTREHSDETKEKIRCGVETFYCGSTKPTSSRKGPRHTCSSKAVTAREAYKQNLKYCTICGIALPYEKRFQKTCSDTCLHIAYSNAGKLAAEALGKRSKNEIAFCTLCENYFGIENVLHNEPMFNRWDADIILLDYKLAILWNGPWHYRKVVENHSLEQVQNRDRLKIAEIINCGFTPYIIKDLSKANDKKVQEEFNKLLEYLAIS